MKGLLIKDFRLLWRQKQFLGAVLVIAAVFSAMYESPSFAMSYMTIFVSLFTVSTISYDEFENGMSFIFTLPVSRKNYVIEKYVFGILLTAGTLALSIAIALAFKIVRQSSYGVEECVSGIAASLVITLTALAVMIPIQLKFGEDRGRIALLVSLGCAVIVGYIIVKILTSMKIDVIAYLDNIMMSNSGGIVIGCCVFGVAAMIVSYLISLKIMKEKQF